MANARSGGRSACSAKTSDSNPASRRASRTCSVWLPTASCGREHRDDLVDGGHALAPRPGRRPSSSSTRRSRSSTRAAMARTARAVATPRCRTWPARCPTYQPVAFEMATFTPRPPRCTEAVGGVDVDVGGRRRAPGGGRRARRSDDRAVRRRTRGLDRLEPLRREVGRAPVGDDVLRHGGAEPVVRGAGGRIRSGHGGRLYGGWSRSTTSTARPVAT